MTTGQAEQQGAAVKTAPDGAGKLYQRDYWGVLTDTEYSPEAVVSLLRHEQLRFTPPLLARFAPEPGAHCPLEEGDVLDVAITGLGTVRVIVAHLDAQTLTLRTLDEHIEAGRITFGAYRDAEGRLNFRIRSRSRAAGPFLLVGWKLGGKILQAKIWVDFIRNVAKGCGAHLADDVHEETHEVHDTLADMGGQDTPTFAPSGFARKAT